MSSSEKVFVVNRNGRVPASVQAALDGLSVASACCRPDEANTVDMAGPNTAAVLALESWSDLDQDDIRAFTKQLSDMAVNALVLAEHSSARFDPADLPPGLVCVGADESDEMLQGRLATLLEMRPVLDTLAAEVRSLRELQVPLNEHFSSVSEEMHLASRLQRDFLPRQLPEMPGIHFATVYRPASWVSGDIYDVTRLDERHIGFYVADAVGHGMPAALLTMFIKRALVTKRITNNHYELVQPGEALKQLNEDMVDQDLSNFQFATCGYGILNIETLMLRAASAGHPMPMRIDAAGNAEELHVTGRLLGVFPDQDYDTIEFQLAPGDKVLLYSDGVELAFEDDGKGEQLRFRKEFGNLADYDVESMCSKLVHTIDRETGSLHPADDVTIVALQLGKQ